MAREAMITRTIVGTKAVCMVVDITKGETLTQTFELAREYKDEKKMYKAIEAQIDDENIKLVHIKSALK